MAVEARISPAGAYLLRLSAGFGDATKRVADGVVTTFFAGLRARGYVTLEAPGVGDDGAIDVERRT